MFHLDLYKASDGNRFAHWISSPHIREIKVLTMCRVSHDTFLPKVASKWTKATFYFDGNLQSQHFVDSN